MIYTLNTRQDCTLIVVEVPEDATDLFVLPIKGDSYLHISEKDGAVSSHSGIKLPPGKWEYISTTKEITEEQAAELVEEIIINHPTDTRSPGSLDYHGWCNYTLKDQRSRNHCHSARESLLSSITAAGGEPGKSNYCILKSV